ncbi:3-dehydroquinate synthase [Patiriisocius marinistellae]|uniref:3-dehydroquinate synthase n=1 Tax=Patiriisocius marinistellae TaxID=2494560 RepID=A0A5J4FWG6_9FLAO|nr:3-dehydroquinate synthase [Patiriisocius marinistellae]GEQ86510.1 3-dehydroquinate synthase [Patiriisocius marinistellae]
MLKIEKEKGAIYFNEGTWKAFKTTLEKLQPSSIFILVDTHTKKHCLPYFFDLTGLKNTALIVEIKTGEEHKNIESCLEVWNTLSENGADRDSLLINLGGGVVTDLGGFVASTFMRGISFINIPTTLLAMVDASVGGKNGVDLGSLKNQIGIINSPTVVLIDTVFLNTLPKNEMNSGFAEMLKHGLISSQKYWVDLKTFNPSNTETTDKLIWESIIIKNDIVTKDPFEKKERKTLNYGHTLGHAIESYCLSNPLQKKLLHGEAIAIGMILATFLSSEILNFDQAELSNITYTFLERYPKVDFSDAAIKDIIQLLKHDKKNRNGEVRFVLLKDFGNCSINCLVDNQLIIDAFNFYKNFTLN